MNSVSARLLLNIAHHHFARDLRHARDCGNRCVPGCGHRALDEWLNEPVTRSDRRADEAREQRLRVLKAGGVPA